MNKTLLIGVLLTSLCVTTGQAEIQVGTAVRTITPSPLLPISGGMGPTSPAREKRGELTARALVLQHEDLRVAIVSVDLLGFPSVLCQRARALVPRMDAEHILIGATHTHSAPDCYGFPDGRGGHMGDLDYMDMVCRQVGAAINEALDSLRPAHIRVAVGEAQGKIAYNHYAPDLYDRQASILQAVSPDGHCIATLVNYAVHPEVLGSDEGILSPDLVGPLYDRIESRVGGMAIFLNGAQGGMVTADNRDLDRPRDAQRGYWEDLRTWEECCRIGQTLANESLRIIKDAPLQTSPILSCNSAEIDFPVESNDLWNAVLHSPLKYPHHQDRRITTRINVVRIGSARILTIPGEALPNIGLYLKRKMEGEHDFLFGLTNDALGYILTKVDYGSFDRYEYISRVSLGEMTGEIFLEKAVELINASP